MHNPAWRTPGSPWENGFIESFNARLRDEVLDGEIFYTLREAYRHRELGSALQHDPAACLDWLQGSCPGGVRASSSRMAVCATPTSSDGHASAGAKTTLNNLPIGPRRAGRSTSVDI
jgi:hypothetical protein